jgi:secreted trypsin-like serine protease
MAKERGTRRAGTNRFNEAILDGRVLVSTFDAPSSKTVTKLEAGGFGGDSGGPMFLKVGDEWRLAGVAAMGESGEQDLLGDYGDQLMVTRVSMYADWIRVTISKE